MEQIYAYISHIDQIYIYMYICSNHKNSFNINRYKNDTKLSVEYWNLKAGNFNPKVTWAVKNQLCACNPQSKRCSLCLNEKLEILEDKEKIY